MKTSLGVVKFVCGGVVRGSGLLGGVVLGSYILLWTLPRFPVSVLPVHHDGSSSPGHLCTVN